jgi:ubiquinone/menaquinone biosynthesis C-methylase UbiE
MTLDSQFSGSIPALYDSCLVPVLFIPYAKDLVARVRELAPLNVLEVAAGTGAVSHLLAETLGREQVETRIVATDLNPAMIEIATTRGRRGNLSFRVANALALPFESSRFDLVLTQFGAMFYPDKILAYREAKRVLTPGGTFLFNVWDRLEANPGSAVIHHAVREAVPEPKPDFMARTPFGYYDADTITKELRAAGFEEITVERVGLRSPPGSALRLAKGMCIGSPLANELASHPRDLQDVALAAAGKAATAMEPPEGFEMSALIVTAR